MVSRPYAKNKKKEPTGILRFLIRLFQIILYIPIQIIFIPFAIIGLIDGIYKEMRKEKTFPNGVKIRTAHKWLADLCLP